MGVAARLGWWTGAALALSLAASPALAGREDDPLAHLAADVSAILDPDGSPILMLNETEFGVGNVRQLAIGDEYNDGWFVVAVTAATVTLTKGRETRMVRLTGRRQAPVVVAQTAPSSPPSSIGASNAGGGISDAVKAGDIRKVLRLGGSARDAYLAYRVTQKGAPIDDTDPNSARFVRGPDGRTTIGFRTSAGLSGYIISAEVAAYSPPGGVDGLPTMSQAFGTRPPG